MPAVRLRVRIRVRARRSPSSKHKLRNIRHGCAKGIDGEVSTARDGVREVCLRCSNFEGIVLGERTGTRGSCVISLVLPWFSNKRAQARVPALPKPLWHVHFVMPDISESAGQSRIIRNATLAGRCIRVTGIPGQLISLVLPWLPTKECRQGMPVLPNGRRRCWMMADREIGVPGAG
jgi:hypothetical protein